MIELSAYEQDAIAELAVAAKSIHWSMFGKEEVASAAQLQAFVEVVE